MTNMNIWRISKSENPLVLFAPYSEDIRSCQLQNLGKKIKSGILLKVDNLRRLLTLLTDYRVQFASFVTQLYIISLTFTVIFIKSNRNGSLLGTLI
jgi:hypothetical protein